MDFNRYLAAGVELGRARHLLFEKGSLEGDLAKYVLAKAEEWFRQLPIPEKTVPPSEGTPIHATMCGCSQCRKGV